MSTAIVLAFFTASNMFNLPPGLLSSLCFVESSHKVNAIHHDDGGANSVGICQVKLETAQMLGFKGTEEDLKDLKTNIHYSAKYLAKQIARYDGDIRKGVAAYNSGKYRPGKDGMPLNSKYVKKVFNRWGTDFNAK